MSQPDPAAVLLLARWVTEERYLVLECADCGTEIEQGVDRAGADVVDLAERAAQEGWAVHNPTGEPMGLLTLLCPKCYAKAKEESGG